VLINNGGIASPHWKDGKTMLDRETLSEWRAYIDTNLTAPFAVSQACLPFMKNEKDTAPVTDDSHSTAGPCIINVGSFRAKQSDPNQEGYASAKAGLLGLTHSMAVSLQPFGIRVNLVAPGRIKATHESKEGDEKGVEWAQLNEDKDVEDHLTNRAGRPLDIAQAVEYMVNAGFVTGQDLIVDGGAVMIK
jgi:NAD(P)-dependent dehydrogenase (short-subunit alcohol dehydrogenase family)